MEVAVYLVLLVVVCLEGTGASLGLQDATVTTITRLNNGDIFAADGGECNSDSCVGLSSGTAISASLEDAPVSKGPCSCQCHRHLPAFREDLHICVDDIHECVLAPFVSGSTSQKIPFVFLPLKGQIIHPSKEISFTGVQTPICAVSGAKFLTESGWMDLRSPLDADVPFRLFRDEGRTFLQWVGDAELRTRMAGRLVLVHLLCRELGTSEQSETDIQSIFTPCVAFRVVGTPTKYLYNVSEVIFSADAHAAEETSSGGLSISEYIAIGISSVLLGLIYVASVFLYLHIRKRRRENDKKSEKRDNQSLNTVEEGVVKSNPLLGLGRHFSGVDNSYSDSGSSDTDLTTDALQKLEDKKKNMQVTAALIHPQHQHIYYDSSPYTSKSVLDSLPQDSASIERHPEENISIVETVEGREDRPETVRAISGTTRRKLYFNPAYFEPELLLAPPPAAIEFLVKIREVISIAKQKMECKRFTPNLLGIPEEDTSHSLEHIYDQSRALSSRRSSMISLKRENSRRRTCTGCPACEPQDLKALCGKLPEFPSLVACKSCTTTAGDSKQRSIQKWLEDVPILKPVNNEDAITRSLRHLSQSMTSPKRLRSPTRSLSPEHISAPFRTLSPRPASERARSPTGSDSIYGLKTSSIRSQPPSKYLRRPVNAPPVYRKPPLKPKAPPPPLPVGARPSDRKQPLSKVQQSLSPSNTMREAITVNGKPEESKIPTIRRNMKAVINEFASQRGLNNHKNSDSSSSPEMSVNRQGVDYETDSLERSGANKGYNTPTEYADVSSSQPSPSLSSALPMAEEMTIRNAILNTKTGNMTVSRLNMENLQSGGNHEYELIVLKKGDNQTGAEASLYKLPQLLQRNNGYSLVSEVYVNNGYNYGSAPSSPSESNCSTLEKRMANVKYEQPEDKPGPLTIQVEDCPDNYIRVEDSDHFEPDTLDRKPSKGNITSTITNNTNINDYTDSLERPNQILLRTTGSFKNNSLTSPQMHDSFNSGFHRTFGSLREIYEYKTKNHLRLSAENLTSLDKIQTNAEHGLFKWKNGTDNREYEGRILTLEERHSKRQRRLNPQTLAAIPPDVIPPPPHSNSPIYEHPKPPRKVLVDVQGDTRPPLPPKNGIGRSTSQKYHKEENVPASPTSDKSYDMPPSSLSGASVSPTSSDYETCTLGEALKKNRDVSDASVLKRLIHSDDVMFKNAINNQFILQTSMVTSSPKLINKTPLKSLRSLMQSEDSNNNTYFNPSNEKHSSEVKKTWNKIISASPSTCPRKPVDSGYLSTDSSESFRRKQNDSERETSGAGSETDESFGDGHSESGAESVETHSVFFGSYRKPYYMTNTCDSGTGSELRVVDSFPNHGDDCASTDSETMSYTTVVPVGSERSTMSSSRSSIIVEH